MIRIGKYTISKDKQHPLNLVVMKEEVKTVESQLIANKMNEAKMRQLDEQGAVYTDDSFIEDYAIGVGDEYEKQEFVGYFPTSKPEMAFERVYSLMVSDRCGMEDELFDILAVCDYVEDARDEIIEATEGVEV